MKTLLLVSLLSLPFSAFAAVDLNTASQAIIDYRKKNGAFKTVDDLDNVPGFGKKSVDTAKKDLTVGNAKAAASGKTAQSKVIKEKTAK